MQVQSGCPTEQKQNCLERAKRSQNDLGLLWFYMEPKARIWDVIQSTRCLILRTQHWKSSTLNFGFMKQKNPTPFALVGWSNPMTYSETMTETASPHVPRSYTTLHTENILALKGLRLLFNNSSSRSLVWYQELTIRPCFKMFQWKRKARSQCL